MTDPAKVDRVPNGLIIDDGRGNVKVHEFSKSPETPKVETPMEAATRRQVELGNIKAEKELALGGSRIGRLLSGGPAKILGAIGFGILVANGGAAYDAVSGWIGRAGARSQTGKIASEGVQSAMSTADVKRDMTVNPDGTVGSAPAEGKPVSADGLGRYGTAFGQVRQLLSDTADQRNLPASQKVCLLNAFDTALAQTAAEVSLDAGRKNIGTFANKFESFGDNAMEACKKGGLDSDFVDSLQSKVFKHDGPIMSQIKGLGV